MSKGLYDPEVHPRVVEGLLRDGKTRQQVAETLGISYQTLRNWDKKYPEFAEAVKIGAQQADDQVVSALFKNAIGYTKNGHYYPPNITAQIFWLKNRQPEDWRDKREFDHKVDLSELSENELVNRIMGLLEGE